MKGNVQISSLNGDLELNVADSRETETTNLSEWNQRKVMTG